MTISLNSKDSLIMYDTRMDYYIDLHNFAGEIVMSFKLPELLSHFNECYCVDVDPDSFDWDVLRDNRKVVIAGTRNWITRNKNKEIWGTPVRDTSFFTSLVIAVEIKKDEINSIIDLFSGDEENLKMVADGILQNTLEIALYRYNEKAGGDSFLVPSTMDCDRLDFSFYINYIEKRYLRCQYVPFHYSLIGKDETPISHEFFNSPINNWRYFLNKSINDLSRKKYVDCIISAAISIESYAWEILKENLISVEAIEEFTTESGGDKKNHLSATKLFKKLKDNGYLNTDLSKTQIERKVQRILNPRNEIMHGKKSVSLSWKKFAEIAVADLTELYECFNEKNDESCFLDNNASDDIVYRDYILKCIKSNRLYSDNDRLSDANEMIKHYPSLQYPIIQKIKALIAFGKYDDAECLIKQAMGEYDNKNAIAVELFSEYYNLHEYDRGIQLFDGIDSLDERSCIALSMLYLNKYRENKVENAECLKNAMYFCNKSYDLNNKYLLRLVIANEILKENKDDTDYYENLKALSEIFEDDYYYPFRCVEESIKRECMTDVIKYLDIFLHRADNTNYGSMLIDFHKITYNMESIINMAELVIKILEFKGYDCTERKKQINHLKDKSYDEINHFDRIGTFAKSKEMPIGNLLYKDLPDIPEGCIRIY